MSERLDKSIARLDAAWERVVTGGLPDPMDNRTEQFALDALREVMAINHSPFLGSDGIRPCLCVVHEDARAALRDEGETT